LSDAPTSPASPQQEQLEPLIERLAAIRCDLAGCEAVFELGGGAIHPSYVNSARNLAHYIALRRHDIRPLQQELAELGLSSLGRAEAHVMATLDAVLTAVHRIAGQPWQSPSAPLAFREGNELLREHTEALLGPAPSKRAVRIMVTMPSEAAADYPLVQELVARGMDCMRINCAYDGPQEWRAMAEHLARARRELGRECRLSMDLAGPKLRVGPLAPGPEVLKIRPRRDALGSVVAPARIRLVRQLRAEPATASDAVAIPVSAGELGSLRTGEQVELVDTRGSKRRMRVTACGPDRVELECSRTTYLASGLELRRRGAGRGVLRIGRLPALERSIVLRKGDEIVLSSKPDLGRDAETDDDGRVLAPARIHCTLPEVLGDVRAGERIWFDDGRIGGQIERVDDGEATIRITQAAADGSRLRANKGINLPDSELRIASLTPKDLEDLEVVAALADIVAMSFVRTPADVEALEAQLTRLGRPEIGILLKIETQQAFDNLPALVLAAMRRAAAGVMIARGDLAVECGFERLAEIQEEILWVCEAAHMPVVWATQVLESLAKTGMPSRAEITDAAMGERAECVMLNKGPHSCDAVGALDDILQRMQDHQVKKSAQLRKLKRW
jgi:pyruvate kinase